MESRKIMVLCTLNQTKKTVETGAENLREFKEALDAANINYSGMTFYEGLTRTELKDDSSLLPQNVPYNGTTTNELVIMLTNPNKNISSGNARQDLYNAIKAAHLEDTIKRQTGKNYTMVSNDKLKEVIDSCVAKKSSAPVKSTKVEDTKCEGTHCTDCENLKKAFYCLLEMLEYNDVLTDDDISTLKGKLYKDEEEPKEEPKEDSPYSDDELESMFGFVK